MRKPSTVFNWKCNHCQKRNKTQWGFTFMVPSSYTADVVCGKCGKKSRIHFGLQVQEIGR